MITMQKRTLTLIGVLVGAVVLGAVATVQQQFLVRELNAIAREKETEFKTHEAQRTGSPVNTEAASGVTASREFLLFGTARGKI